MTVRRLLAIAVIFAGCAIAWFTLGWSLVVRTGQFDRQLTEQVSLLWGAPHVQLAPESWVARPREVSEQVFDKSGNGRDLEREVRKTVTEWFPAPLVSSRVDAALDLDHRQKGLLWYDTYAVSFRGTYVIENPDTVERQLRLTFTFPSPQAMYDDFTLAIDGVPATRTGELGKEIETVTTLAPRGRATLTVGYQSRGLDDWRYAFGPSGIAEVRDFELSLRTNFSDIDFPPGTMSPTGRTEAGDGWQITWRFANMVTGQAIGVDLPNRVNPGPLAARITFFAPVSLLFFLTVMVILDMRSGESLHPMHYFFISAAFFAFHLLLAYLVDRLSLFLSFTIAATVSLALVGSYLAAAARVTSRLKPALAAQAIYLVAFSTAFFFEGLTGLAVTIGAIITLFVLMQMTARLNWSEVFGGRAEAEARRPS